MKSKNMYGKNFKVLNQGPDWPNQGAMWQRRISPTSYHVMVLSHRNPSPDHYSVRLYAVNLSTVEEADNLVNVYNIVKKGRCPKLGYWHGNSISTLKRNARDESLSLTDQLRAVKTSGVAEDGTRCPSCGETICADTCKEWAS